MQDSVLSLNLALKCVRSFKFKHKQPNETTPNQIALKQTIQNQTKAFIAKSSCIDRWENTAWLKLIDTNSLKQSPSWEANRF